MVLALNQGIVVAQQVTKLLHRGDLAILVVAVVGLSAARIPFLHVENLHTANFLINSGHEFSQTLEIHSEFLHEFFTTFLEGLVEKLLPDQLDLVSELLLRLNGRFL